VGKGVADCSGWIEGEGNAASIAGEVGMGESCATATEDKMAIRNGRLVLVVMSSEVETSLAF